MKKSFTTVGYTAAFSLIALGALAFLIAFFMAPTLDQDALGSPEIRAMVWNLSWLFLTTGALIAAILWLKANRCS